MKKKTNNENKTLWDSTRDARVKVVTMAKLETQS